jgi:hypothetical protein
MLLVVTVERDGDENTVTAEFLDSQANETTKFKCQSVEPVLEAGDFVNMKANEISFLHAGTHHVPRRLTDRHPGEDKPAAICAPPSRSAERPAYTDHSETDASKTAPLRNPSFCNRTRSTIREVR